MMKHIFLALLLLASAVLAKNTETDLRLNHYPKALEWLKDADTNGESAYNIGVLYDQHINDDNKAIEWYKKAYKMDDKSASGSSANNLGYLYNSLQKYNNAIDWYNKGMSKNNTNAIVGLGLLYDNKKHITREI